MCVIVEHSCEAEDEELELPASSIFETMVILELLDVGRIVSDDTVLVRAMKVGRYVIAADGLGTRCNVPSAGWIVSEKVDFRVVVVSSRPHIWVTV